MTSPEPGSNRDSDRAIAASAAKLQELILILAELFPACFVAEAWRPHKPLKVGIGNDLITRGVLQRAETEVLRRYTLRRMYQVALAAGGPRYDLDGNVAGEATPEQLAGAKAMLARIDARKTRKAKAIADKQRAAHKATTAIVSPKVPRDAPPGAAVPSATSARLSLADLKAAARARREAQGGAPSGGAR